MMTDTTDGMAELRRILAERIPELPADLGELRGRAAAEFLFPRLADLVEDRMYRSRKGVILAAAGRVNELWEQRRPNCPKCNVAPELHNVYNFALTCPSCFEQAEDLVSGLGVAGESVAKAEQAWRAAVTEYIEDNAP